MEGFSQFQGESSMFAQFTIVMILLASACSTQVDVGRNGRERDFKQADKADEQRRESLDESTEKGLVSCYGAAEKLPEDLEEFCSTADTSERLQFAKIYNAVCRQKLFSYLFHPDCGWDGHSDINNYVKVIEATPLDAPASVSSYYHYVAYSITTPPSPTEYLSTVLLAHANPGEFAKKYKAPTSLRFIPSRDGVLDVSRGKELIYTAEITTYVAGIPRVLTFNAVLHAYQLKSGLAVLSDYVTGNRSGINVRNHLSFSKHLADGRGKTVVIEELEVPNIAGPTLREIAARTLADLDKDLMRMIHANALVH